MARFLLVAVLLLSAHANAGLRESCKNVFQYFATREHQFAGVPFLRQFELRREPPRLWGRWVERILPRLLENHPSITVQGAEWTVAVDQIHEKITFHVKCSPRQRNHILRSLVLTLLDQTRKNLGKPVPIPNVHIFDDGLHIKNIFVNEYGQKFLEVFEKLIDTVHPYQSGEFNFANRPGVIELDFIEHWIMSNIEPEGLDRPTVGDIMLDPEEVPSV